ncbi:MAG TPA: DUF58 domain-containing protein [Gemmataceae bacterium]|jgi:uncharacterized protein (DUF58 family)
MLPPDVGRQLRRLQLRARRAVANLLGGEYHSVFKGTGLAFADVRAYQPGDDVRAIDWNVTARIGQPFLKRFVEERELTVLFAVDASASLAAGTRRQPKREVVAELAALLAFAALHNNDRVGLLHCTDRVEHVVPPRKGARHAQRLLRDILFYQPTGRGTGLRTALDALNRAHRKRAIVFLFSDFLDTGFEKALRLAGRRHDLVAVWVRDPLEEELPDVGLLELADAETGARVLIDTGSAAVRRAFAANQRRRQDELRRLFRGAGVDAIEVSTAGGHLDALVAFFRRREQRLKHQ